MSTYVYKYVLNGEIIYVGKADCGLEKRLSQHGKPGDNIPEYAWNDINNADIFFVKLANKVMSDVFESEMIRRYKPKYNKAKADVEWSGLPFVEPKWEKYIPQIDFVDFFSREHGAGEKNKTISARVNRDIWNDFKRISNAKSLNANATLNMLISEYVFDNKKYL